MHHSIFSFQLNISTVKEEVIHPVDANRKCNTTRNCYQHPSRVLAIASARGKRNLPKQVHNMSKIWMSSDMSIKLLVHENVP